MSAFPALTDEFLAKLVAEFSTPEHHAALLGGSVARGAATEWSDVDLAFFPPDGTPIPDKRYVWRRGWLVSVGVKTIAGWRAQLYQPDRAIFAVSSLRESRILFDRDGALAVLQTEARSIPTEKWDALLPERNRRATFYLLESMQWALKVAGGLAANNAGMLAYATERTVDDLTMAVATQRLLLITSQNTMFDQIDQVVGVTSNWSMWRRRAVGYTQEGAVPDLAARGQAALRFYLATVDLLSDAIAPGERDAIRETADRVRQALRQLA